MYGGHAHVVPTNVFAKNKHALQHFLLKKIVKESEIYSCTSGKCKR